MQSLLRLVTASVVAVGLITPGMALAQDRTVPDSRQEMQLSFSPLVKQTHGSVVNVYAERKVQRSASPFGGDPFFEQFFGQQFPTRTQKQESLGSGVIVEANGTIVTNNHVVEGADDIKVALSDGREFPCKVLLKDKSVDLAVLKIETDERFQPIKLGNSDSAEVGDLVLAIGNPFGVGQTVTSGIVSGLARNQITDGDFGFFIQTDASINPGNSGGALMNMKGELIGLNTAIFSRGGGSNGVGFAIPANLVKVFLAAAENGDKSFERPYVGASFDPVTSDVAEALGLEHVLGALVVKVVPGGPADKAGLKSGEVITAVDGVTVEHPDALAYRLTTTGIGKSVDLTVMDNGRKTSVELPLAGAPETVPADARTLSGRSPFAGAKVANLSPKLAIAMRLPVDSTGVVIEDFDDNSTAAQLGFAKGDIILSVNGQDVGSTKDMAAIAASSPRYWRVAVSRGGQVIQQIFR
ncbi:DegQ family serine endoprotease [Rhizobium halophytocola]|uniref:Do/DeqQ family serine protease n=1 Tax=Rhizobium halophytocola TaxID=735519 RepID=A0ABS4DVT1_9HYPH|nr:DegQ family serine endoprotease [Rhizobium halophytocola]MBP1849798.1 Do/DeqQ family serine protease [Rhizobium halophytocola]